MASIGESQHLGPVTPSVLKRIGDRDGHDILKMMKMRERLRDLLADE